MVRVQRTGGETHLLGHVLAARAAYPTLTLVSPSARDADLVSRFSRTDIGGIPRSTGSAS
jgi:hypothetical protein